MKTEDELENSLEILNALADETRLKIIDFLLDGEKCVCEIFPHVKRTQSTVSIQLGKLEKWGILESRRDGKRIFYGIKDRRVCDIFKALGYAKGAVLEKRCCTEKIK
ncbi:MAG: metalloregulator ArsR/SmtB family transcription factor [Candidatus Aenigmatarchaeota archaeon]